MGSNPANPFNFRVSVVGAATNRSGVVAPLRACYGWREGAWNEATVTNVAPDAPFEMDVLAEQAEIFHVGFRLDGTDPVPPDYTTPSYYIYGWASLLWDGATLSLVDSAAETRALEFTPEHTRLSRNRQRRGLRLACPPRLSVP